MKKIIFLGDSITDASHCFLENPLGNGYVNMEAEKLNDSGCVMKKYDIINDKRYASMYIEYKGKTRSGRQISQDLMIKGISKDIISESFESTDYSDADSLKKIIDKRAKRYNLDDRKDLQKLYQYLMGKGYKYSDIKNELSEYFEHLESQFDDEI